MNQQHEQQQQLSEVISQGECSLVASKAVDAFNKFANNVRQKAQRQR